MKRGIVPPSQMVPPPLIMAVGSGLTVTAIGIWFVTQLAMFVSLAEILPPTFPKNYLD
jgi:hypothetical protein